MPRPMGAGVDCTTGGAAGAEGCAHEALHGCVTGVGGGMGRGCDRGGSTWLGGTLTACESRAGH
eukprot:scaffold28033_cov152-Isochrysis_galbana.AAC.2